MSDNREIKKQMKEQAKEVEKAVKKYKTEYGSENVRTINHLRAASTKLRTETYTEYQNLSQDLGTLNKTNYALLDVQGIEKVKKEIEDKKAEIEAKYHALIDLDAKNKALYELITEKMGKEYNFSNAHDLAEFILDLIKCE